ncbi:50S ribosomal protein L33 [Mesomycoplasma hyopneumoniae]|uniref:Large ribosomal subunit protein bL33 n=2 Tax=Mesomycoplasma hyopneumoniae (strain 168) TaxID=907287 RepID=E4QTU4_MESH1|nr:50S ribosomal protein L33 [Mesomycoplasma hyopneumoniae]ADQ90921.1 50S ribosomal protein L33 [Mesomycoplasma hyopneumoniae 168]AGM22413.1 50S ribosomal protein L33 [Mesomycoplasma hyopneumoniae 168-L]MXR10980.1 50S ribosomal protein L33 [Mesomycoplasma hyopneumoniae]MXR12675.1 50S ribosomal protein L33 [Mesomycoplasma hyopneumoniae]MXR33458.1 50S ribosomal protein L33 [Mesomycoplasma hyopneumoniae]
MKKKISLSCSLCKNRNYKTNKSVQNRLQINKFCKICRKSTLHQEEK